MTVLNDPEVPTAGHSIYEIGGLQRTLASVFANSWTKTPLIHVGAKINVAKAEAFRLSHGERFGCRISMTVFIQKCVALAARDYPLLSGIIDGDGDSVERVIVPAPDEIAITGPVMIGDTAMPITIEQASSKSLVAIAREMTATVADLRGRELGIDDSLAGFQKLASIPNIGISNIGMMGKVDFFTAVCITPSVAALYVPATIMTPIVAEDGTIVAAPCVNFCLAFDHRVLAAGPIAQFFDRFRDLMEHPERHLVEFGEG
ncbi:MAG: 2-oxo acid dehydrogenase subunit E2 [Sphingobium sp.]|nr:2-oxo acid dehydrogenase subunit E2 [Sphingobium sp.]